MNAEKFTQKTIETINDAQNLAQGIVACHSCPLLHFHQTFFPLFAVKCSGFKLPFFS